MARYDYGLRGPRDTTDPRFDQRGRAGYRPDVTGDPSGGRFSYRVTRSFGADRPGHLDGAYPYEHFPFGSGSPDPGVEGHRLPGGRRGQSGSSRLTGGSNRYDDPRNRVGDRGRYPDDL